MYLFFMLWILTFTTTRGSNTVLQTTGYQYSQMNYLPVQSALGQYNLNSKKLCVAQCARLSSTCNIAVFDSIAVPHCVLYSESLTMTNLVPSTNTIVVDFGRSNSNGGRNKMYDELLRFFKGIDFTLTILAK